MSLPNGGLITENNEQYYSGVQKFLSIAGQWTRVYNYI